MEALVSAVTATCPSAYAGASGGMFLHAITTILATHCAVVDDSSWPKDRANEIFEKSEGGLSYDFIVVGAGTAGSIVASRLSNIYPHLSVLLVEAGENPGIDSEIPAFSFFTLNSNTDWAYQTEPDGNSCLSSKDNSCLWNKGKGIGGSSSLNAMLYIRGHPKDFDLWKEMGNDSWDYNNMKYYFELLEKKFNISDVPRTNDIWYNVLDDAWNELQFTSHSYDGHEGLIGTKKSFLLTKDGKRLNTAKVILNEAKNLHVIKNTMVQNLILDNESENVKGIHITHSNGLSMDILANKEVTLSAGSIGTPQILMFSGIGPKKHLNEIGIECKLNLPVGQNLQDHLVVPLFLKTNKHITLTPEMMNFIILQYMSTGKGPLSNIGISDFFGFIDTKNLSDYPNIQYHHLYFTKNDVIMFRQLLVALGYKSETIEAVLEVNKQQDILGICPTLLHPKSRGEILLRDANLYSQPVIKPNYLHHPDDMQSFIEAIEFIHKLEKTETFRSLGIEILQVELPSCSNFKFDTKPYWDCYLRHMAVTIFHPVGTVKMGNDDSSVVDNKMLVHGMKNLRVVDASIMPTIPGGNTMATTLAIAYKAVDLITKQYNIKEEL